MSNDEYSGENRKDERWHIKKEVTWGHLVSTMVLAGVVSSSYIEMGDGIQHNQAKMAENKKEIEHVRELNELNTGQLKEAIHEVGLQYEKIDGKLDKLIDRELNGH